MILALSREPSLYAPSTTSDGPNCKFARPYGPDQLIWWLMIRKLSSGEYRLYSRKLDPKTQRHRNLGTFKTRSAAEKHEREVQYFKRH